MGSVPFDNCSARSRGRLHLSFNLGGKRIRYAYIRKNGSSSFKVALGFDPSTSVSIIRRKNWHRSFGHHDAKIFVWRDPEERLISLFRDKIVAKNNAVEIIDCYRKVMGEEPSTFEKFVRFSVLGADPHCWSQSSHLMPMRYTHAIPLDCLYQVMSEIVGSAAAAPFRERTNESRHISVNVTSESRRMIRSYYRADYMLINALRR